MCPCVCAFLRVLLLSGVRSERLKEVLQPENHSISLIKSPARVHFSCLSDSGCCLVKYQDACNEVYCDVGNNRAGGNVWHQRARGRVVLGAVAMPEQVPAQPHTATAALSRLRTAPMMRS